MSFDIEDALPGITRFLRLDLARERLSLSAESSRLDFVARIDARQRKDPEAMKLGDMGYADMHTITESVRLRNSLHVQGQDVTDGGPTKSQDKIYRISAENEKRKSTKIESITEHCEAFGAYDEIQIKGDKTQLASGSSNQAEFADDDSFDSSGTDYESYEDEAELKKCLYDEIYPPELSLQQNCLREKRASRRRSSHQNKRSSLPARISRPIAFNITFSGDLYQKGVLKMTKRYGIIHGSELMLFISKTQPQPIMSLLLTGYEVLCQEKEGKFHELRISCPGRETHWFFSKRADMAKQWTQELNKAANLHLGSNVAQSSSSDDHASKKVEVKNELDSHDADQSENISGGSLDTAMRALLAINPPLAPNSASESSPSTEKKKKSNVMKTLKETFGKKKGSKLTQMDVNEMLCSDPDAVISGIISIYTENGNGGGKWVKHFCVVKNSQLECYKDETGAKLEFVISLHGASLSSGDKESKKEYTFKLVQGKHQHLYDVGDSSEHAKWMKALREAVAARSVKEDGKKGPSVQKDVKENLSYEGDAYIYDEIRQFPQNTCSSVNISRVPPPLPASPPPTTPPADSEEHKDAKLINLKEHSIYLEPADVSLNSKTMEKTVPEEATYLNSSEFSTNVTEQKEKLEETKKGGVKTSMQGGATANTSVSQTSTKTSTPVAAGTVQLPNNTQKSTLPPDSTSKSTSASKNPTKSTLSTDNASKNISANNSTQKSNLVSKNTAKSTLQTSPDNATKGTLPPNNIPKSISPLDTTPKSTVPPENAPKCTLPSENTTKSTLPPVSTPKSTPPSDSIPKSTVSQGNTAKSTPPSDGIPKSTVSQGNTPKSTPPSDNIPKSTLSQGNMPKSTPPSDGIPKSTLSQGNTPKSTPPADSTPKSTSPPDNTPKSTSTPGKVVVKSPAAKTSNITSESPRRILTHAESLDKQCAQKAETTRPVAKAESMNSNVKRQMVQERRKQFESK